MDERDVDGYSVTYGRDETQFAVYVIAVLAAAFLAAAWMTGLTLWLVLGAAAAGAA